MLTSHQATLARVALAMGLTPAQAVALPAVVERSAGLVARMATMAHVGIDLLLCA